MISIARESFDAAYASAEPLLHEHWREIALYQDQIPLEVDVERYRAADAAGNLVCLSARDAGAMVGYAAWLLVQHPHYRSCRFAMNDVIYVRRQHRTGSTVGLRLIRESERVLVEDCGVNRIQWHLKSSNDWSAILLRMGYACEETVFGKYVGS